MWRRETHEWLRRYIIHFAVSCFFARRSKSCNFSEKRTANINFKKVIFYIEHCRNERSQVSCCSCRCDCVINSRKMSHSLVIIVRMEAESVENRNNSTDFISENEIQAMRVKLFLSSSNEKKTWQNFNQISLTHSPPSSCFVFPSFFRVQSDKSLIKAEAEGKNNARCSSSPSITSKKQII